MRRAQPDARSVGTHRARGGELTKALTSERRSAFAMGRLGHRSTISVSAAMKGKPERQAGQPEP